jgi:hypothetical protein
MTQFRRVFSKTAEIFWQYPWLWVPVLAVDAGRYIAVEVIGVLRRAAISALIPRSVLGGYAGPENHLPFLPLIVGGALEWLGYLLSLSAYIYLMGVLARSVPAVQSGVPPRSAIAWDRPAGIVGVFGKTLLALLFCIGAALFTPSSVYRAGLPFVYVVMGASAVIAVFALSGPLRAFIDVNGPGRTPVSTNRWTDSALLLFGIVVGNGLGFAIRFVVARDPNLAKASHAVWGYLLGCVLSLATAMPYAFTLIGLAMREPATDLARPEEGEALND